MTPPPHHHHINHRTLTLFLLLLTLTTTTTVAQPQLTPSFKCTSTTTCKALVGYISPNKTTLSHIQTLFQVKTLRTLLGVNNLPPTTPPTTTIPANATLKIPFPCRCSNGTGLSNKVPKYKVVKDDGLYHIAAQVFSGLVTDNQIQAANGIKDINLIYVGQELWVPLPCSCDDVEGVEGKVVHYGHVVKGGSSVESISGEFGVTSEVLMSVNGIKDAKDLMAGQVLDVPLQACNSSVSSTSFDYPLLVPNGTYVDTAHNCVMCKCDLSHNQMLQCQPSGRKSVDWPTCPAMQCASSNMTLGNSTVLSSCSSSVCDYAGFNKNRTIFTTMAESSTCPGNAPGDKNGGLKIHSRGWTFAVVVLLLIIHRFF